MQKRGFDDALPRREYWKTIMGSEGSEGTSSAKQQREAPKQPFEESGLEHRLLAALADRGAMTVFELAARAGITEDRISGPLERLEAKGYATTKSLKDDISIAKITREGRRAKSAFGEPSS